MQVERETGNRTIQPSNVAISIFFETPEQLYTRVYREIRPQGAIPSIQVKYCRFANANSSIRHSGQGLTVKIADVLEESPAHVAEALAHILLSKLFRRPIASIYQIRYRQWLNRQDVRDKVHQVRQERGRKVVTSPKGENYDLEEIFQELNRSYFEGKMTQPSLGWSRNRSRTRLGHFDPSHHMIVISRIMDAIDAPRVILEYVMYHEMLHLLHPEELCGNRRRIHTPEFRAAERKFPDFKEVQKTLRKFLSRK